jgi:hypothetical protein
MGPGLPPGRSRRRPVVCGPLPDPEPPAPVRLLLRVRRIEIESFRRLDAATRRALREAERLAASPWFARERRRSKVPRDGSDPRCEQLVAELVGVEALRTARLHTGVQHVLEQGATDEQPSVHG